MTVEEYARKIGKHPKTVYRWIREGVLKPTRVGGRWEIYESTAAPTIEPLRPGALLERVLVLERAMVDLRARVEEIEAVTPGLP